MGARPFVTTGIALASAGILVASVPTIAPPLTPREVQVAADVQTTLAAAKPRLATAEEAFANPASLSEGLRLAAIAAGVPAPDGAAAGGNALDPLAQALRDPAFVQQLLLDPALVQDLVDAFFEGGVSAVVGTVLLAASDAIFGVDSFPSGLINAFFFGYPPLGEGETTGFVAAAHFIIDTLIGGVDLPPEEAAPAELIAVDVAGSIGTGPMNAAQIAQLPTSIADVVDAFFEGGVSAVVGTVLLDASDAIFGVDSFPSGLVNSFFFGYPPLGEGETTGFVAAAHFIIDTLIGDVDLPPEEEAAVAQTEETNETATLAAAGSEAAAGSTVEEPSATAGTTGVFGSGLPAVNETPNRAPRLFDLSIGTPTDEVEESVTETDAEDAVTEDEVTDNKVTDNKVTEDEVTEDEVTDNKVTEDEVTDNKVTEEELNSGNKVEVDPILLENGTGGGGSAWDETVKRWQDFGSKLGFGGGAAEPDADSETEGSEAGS